MTAVPYITKVLGAGSFQYGVASACYGAASIVSSIVAGKLSFPGGARRWLVAAGLVYGLVNLVMVAQPGFLTFCLLWVVWGLAYGPEEVATQLVFVRAVAEEMQGRLFSLMNVVMTLATGLGTAVVGPLSDHLGPTRTMAIAGVIFIAATLGCFAIGPGARAIGTVKLGTQRGTSGQEPTAG
jgi:predicted MFS family arabinose efflux permease